MRNKTGKARTVIFTGAAALGLTLGSVGIGWAMSPTTAPPPQPIAQVSQAATGQDATQLGTDATEAPELNEATEASEVDEAVEEQEPSYAASITAPQDEGLSEADEAIALEGLASITPDQARDAALAVVPGTVDKVELDNENGAVVYSVEITDASGSHIDVKVDAGNGTVVHQDADDGDNEG